VAAGNLRAGLLLIKIDHFRFIGINIILKKKLAKILLFNFFLNTHFMFAFIKKNIPQKICAFWSKKI